MAESYQESKPKTFKFGVVGDFLKGVYLKRDKTTNPDKYNKLSYIYTVKAIEGSFHDSVKNEKTGKSVLNNDPTIINPGDEYSIFINVESITAGKMNDGKIGQKFMIKFDETKDTGKGNDAKIIKVFWAKDDKTGAPIIDEDWAKENVTLADM